MSNKLPNGWKEYKLGEVAKIVGGGTPKTDIDEYWNRDIPWITPKDLSNFNGRYISKGERNISEKGLVNSSAKLLPPGTILLTSRAPVGYLAIAENEITTNQGFRSLVPLNNIDNIFLFYLLKNNIEYLKSHATGTTFGELAGSVLKSLVFLFPPLPEQRAIASVLSSLDDKIELNRRMNETLEAIARAIFKSWFVDFDPVRAKAEGREPAGMDAETAALFPDSFEETELGMVPKGWRVETIGTVLELAYGKALKEDCRKPGKIPVFGSNGQVGWHDEKLADGPGIIVGRKGNPGIVTWSPTDFFSIDTTFYVKPKGPCKSMFYLFHNLCNQDLVSLGSDSAVPGLNRNLAYGSQMLVPSAKVLEIFDKHIAIIYEKIHANDKQNRNIAAMRDALLPKLLSGEVRTEVRS